MAEPVTRIEYQVVKGSNWLALAAGRQDPPGAREYWFIVRKRIQVTTAGREKIKWTRMLGDFPTQAAAEAEAERLKSSLLSSG
jgi:hypothetical protein